MDAHIKTILSPHFCHIDTLLNVLLSYPTDKFIHIVERVSDFPNEKKIGGKERQLFKWRTLSLIIYFFIYIHKPEKKLALKKRILYTFWSYSPNPPLNPSFVYIFAQPTNHHK